MEEAAGTGGEVRVGLGADAGVRWAAVDLTAPLRDARERLDLSPVAAGALGRCLAAAALVRELSSGPPRHVVVAIASDGSLSRVVAEADASGRLRGMVSAPRVEVPLAASVELGVKRALGNGVLSVLCTRGEATHRSQVELENGRLGLALARYLEQSEGIRSAVILGVLAEASGITGAGGMIVEALPGADDRSIGALEEHLAVLSGVGRTLAASGLDGLVTMVLGGVAGRVTGTRRLHYGCSCTSGKIRRHLAALPQEELEALRLDDGSLEAECVFCGVRYRFRHSDLVA